MSINSVRQLQSAITSLHNADGDVSTSSGCACDQPDGSSVSQFQQKKDQQMMLLETQLKQELSTLA